MSIESARMKIPVPEATDPATRQSIVDICNAIEENAALKIKEHVQGTDPGLDAGGANAVTAAQAKAGYTHSGTPHAPASAEANPAAASQVEAETGTEAAVRTFSPLRIFQAIAAWVSDNLKGEWSGHIEEIADKAYTLCLETPFAGTISKLTAVSVSGTVTLTVNKNGVALGSSLNVTDGKAEQTNIGSFAAGDKLDLVASSNSACLDMAFSVVYAR